MNSGVNRRTQRLPVTWYTAMLRSASSSPTSRQEMPYRRYQPTETPITSRGNRKSAKTDEEPGRRHHTSLPPTAIDERSTASGRQSQRTWPVTERLDTD
jgi:hypothetical protein